MNSKERFDLIKRNTEEIIGEEDLMRLLENNERLKHYIGFEISGFLHIGSGLMSMSKIKDFMNAGVECNVFLADWHTWINDKLGGDMNLIKRVAIGYFKEGLKASMLCVKGDPEKINFVLGSELYHHNDKYWETVIDISKNTTLSRINRSITIMGRKEGESIDFAKLIYPPMQVADIFVQGINIAHAGLDQRKAHVIARDVALKLKVSPLLNKNNDKIKPVAVHHPLLLGLGKPPVWPIPQTEIKEVLSALKMSKSKPETSIFLHDEPDEIRRKISNAFCPEGYVDFNPVLNWTKYIVFMNENSKLTVKRPEKFGGDVIYKSYNELETDFAERKLHPLDLKKAVAEEIIKILEPAREHFKRPSIKKTVEEMKKLTITR